MGRRKGVRALIKAARSGVASDVVAQLKEVSPDDPDRFGTVALSVSAFHGHTDCVRVLLAHGADPQRSYEHGDTALHQACRSGSAECLAVLADAVEQRGGMEGLAAMLSEQSAWGSTPLHVAVQGQQFDVIKLFAMYLPRVEEHLRSSTLQNDRDYINFICRGERIVDIDDHEGDTILHEAVRSGNTEITEYILQHLAPHPLAENAFGETPVDLARYCDNEQMALMLDLYLNRFVQSYGDARIAPRHTIDNEITTTHKREKAPLRGSDSIEFHGDLERSLMEPAEITKLERLVLQQCTGSAPGSSSLLAVYQGKADDGQKLMFREYVDDDDGLNALYDKIANLYHTVKESPR